MSKRNTIILALLFVILVVEIIIIAPKEIGTQIDAVPTAAVRPATENSGQYMQNVYSVEAKKNGKEWELWADKALQPKANQEWTIERVKVMFYATNGVTYKVTGKQGHVIPNPTGIRDIRISGNVVTETSNGHVFKTESIDYDSKNRLLKSPSDVEMTSPPDKDGGEMVLTGTDMVADLSNNEITVKKNVKARKRVKDKRTVHITSQRAVFSGRTRMAQFYDDVVIDVDEMKITGPEAKFAYDPSIESFSSVLVAGGIRVTDAEKFATSQSVDVNFKDDRVVFRGSPRVVQSGDELVGDEIVFFDGGHKVQVQNAKAQFDPKTVQSQSPPPKTGPGEKKN